MSFPDTLIVRVTYLLTYLLVQTGSAQYFVEIPVADVEREIRVAATFATWIEPLPVINLMRLELTAVFRIKPR